MTCKHVMAWKHVEIYPSLEFMIMAKSGFLTVAKSKLDKTCFAVISSESIQTRSRYQFELLYKFGR
jgi:hypothetical protein